MITKTCKTCKITQPLEAFAKNKNCADGHLTECKSCNKLYRQANAGRRRVTAEALRRKNGIRPKTRFATDDDRRKARIAAAIRWQQRNEDVYKQKQRIHYKDNRTRLLVEHARWRKQNAHKVNAYTAKRRADLARATPAWADLRQILSIYEDAHEMTLVTGVEHHVDHIIPLNGKYVCGLHVHQNLQVLSKAENLEKSNKHPDHFYLS